MRDTTGNWLQNNKFIVGVIALTVLAAIFMFASSRDRNQAIESSNTGVSSGVNDGEEAVPPKETSNY